MPWRYKIKDPIVESARVYLWDNVRSRLHSKSLLSYRLNLFLQAGLKENLPVLTEADYQFGQSVMLNEVIRPLVTLAKERNVKIGFLYVPRLEEAINFDSDKDNQWRMMTLENFEISNVIYVDAKKYLRNRPDAYLEFDKHPSKTGHYFLYVLWLASPSQSVFRRSVTNQQLYQQKPLRHPDQLKNR